MAYSIAASGRGPENLVEFHKRFGPFPGNTAWLLQSTHDMVDVADLADKDVPYRIASPCGALHDLALVPTFISCDLSRSSFRGAGSCPRARNP